MIGREKFIRIIPSLVVFMIVSYGFGYNLSIWKKSNESFNSEVKSIFISKNENVYVGTSKALFASGNGGKDFNFVFSPPGENITINDIAAKVAVTEILLVAVDPPGINPKKLQVSIKKKIDLSHLKKISGQNT